MAKITLICDQPEHPWALEFQKSLACLGDHVELYHPESSIFAATDFVHFLIFDESPQFPWKNLLKSSLWGAWQKSKFIASFFECTEKSFHNPQVRWLLELCDLITLPSPDLLVRFHRMGLMDETLQLEIIPAQIFSLPEEMGSGKFQHEHKELEELLTRIQPYILIPLNFSSKFLKSPWIEILKEYSQSFSLLFLGTKEDPPQDLPHNLYTCGSLNEAELQSVIQRSRALSAAFFPIPPGKLSRLAKMCQASQTPCLADEQQLQQVPGLALPGRTGWVLDKGLRSLEDVLRTSPQLSLKYSAQPHVLTSMDQSINLLSRYYKKIASDFNRAL